MFKKLSLLAASVAGAGALAMGGAAAAHAAPMAHAVTHVLNRPDGGHGGIWAFDTFNRDVTVTVANSQQGAGAGNTRYRVDITDRGGFATVLGAGTPNQFVPGTTVLHKVHGVMAGGITYTVVAPSTDALTGTVPAVENDAFGPAHVTTSDWAKQVFANPALVTAPEPGSVYNWKYSTGCETWTDSSANGDGNLAGDGNITGVLCSPVLNLHLHPYVYGGHVITDQPTRATVGWSDGLANDAAAWGSGTVGGSVNHCVEVQEYGFGFSATDGSPHVGFTCDNGNPAANVGYLTGLTPGHTYALRIQPAVGTYASHHPIPGTDDSAHVTVVTVS